MRYDLPIPYGWFCVGLSADLQQEGVKPLRYFGEDLVMFRTASGQAVVLDVYDWEIGTIVQETGENAVDTAHFIYVHKVTSFPAGDITIEGHRRTTDITMKARAVNPETGVVDLEGEEVVRGHLVTKSIGPGQTVQYLKTYFETIMIGTITPIDSERVHLRFCFSQPASVSEDQASIARSQIDTTVFQVTQDIPIWENKRYMDSPLLCDGDGPIHKYRKWFSQFYDQLDDGSDSLSA